MSKESKPAQNVTPAVAPEMTEKERAARVDALLAELRTCDSTMRNEQKRIRRQLRRLGHRGGLMRERIVQREAAAKAARDARAKEAQKAQKA